MKDVRRGWTPSNWASLKPFGIGEQRPNNYLEVLRAIGENRDELGYAWRILKEGVCDGCALGTMGMKDWTLDGVHLCNIRLRLLRLNTMPALDENVLGDVGSLLGESGKALRDLGRLPYPMVRRKGEKGFRRTSWDDALNLVADEIKKTSPDRLGFYLTSRGMPNEAYYAAQKAVRAMGTNSIDNAARVCHSPSTTALKASVGVGATTCSYRDWLHSDLIVFIGSNVANNQPVTTKYLHYAKKNGAKIAVINPYREPGMERYWIPSILESALFGTKLADRFFLINGGGDIAFLSGTLKVMSENVAVDGLFINEHTTGFAELMTHLAGFSWDTLEKVSGTPRSEMASFADMLSQANRCVFVWSMGITQHESGVENVQAIINLALSKGYVGREGCGLMPIRGHSGVQGGAEMGAYATALPGGLPVTEENVRELGKQWGFEVPAEEGMTAPEMIDAAHEGRLDVLFSVGGNFLDVLPDPKYVERALEGTPLRVHMDVVISRQMLCDTAGTVVLLPAATRYETPGGVTQTSTERRVIFSPEIEGRRVGEARPEWEVFLDLARRVRPELRKALSFAGTPALREEIARVIPFYEGIQRLSKAGDQFQYGGERLCEGWKFPTSTGKAKFIPVGLPVVELASDEFLVSTRRGKQFNSMVYENKDAITGAVREAVLMNSGDAGRLKLRDGDGVVLEGKDGTFAGVVFVAPMAPGNLQVHWPEGNVLINRAKRAPGAGIPAYTAVVRIRKGKA